MMTGSQIRAARALLSWSRDDLAEASGLHKNSVAHWEIAGTIPTDFREPQACRLMRAALLRAGVEIISNGVRYVPRPMAKGRKAA